MEAGTGLPTTGSHTIADLAGLAAERFGDAVAIRHKVDGAWQDVTYGELGDIASEIAGGLIDLGVERGDRVALLANTRPEWTYADFGITSAGATVVPIYPSNSPEECHWVVSDSEASIVVCEDASQVAKITAVRDRLPALQHVIVMVTDPARPGDTGDAITVDELRERGRALGAAAVRDRVAAVAPEDPYTFIYTSGTTGNPKGCVLSHANYRSVLDMIAERSLFKDEHETVYLYLPLAHAFALLVMLGATDTGTTIAYWGGDTKQIIAELNETHPTYLPSVPRIFEKIYTLVTANAPAEMLAQAVAVGKQVRTLQQAGEAIPAELQAGFDQADEALFKNVRAAFGGRLREAVTGAAPIAKDILEFFWACGIPVMEGYGMTETSTVATSSSPADHRFGTVGKALPGVEIKIADDGEILIKGPNVFNGYWNNADASFGAVEDGWLHTGDVGSLDEDGYLSITGRKKDIIITAGGKNLTPANLENDMKQCRWVSQAVMHGDRRAYPSMLVTLDEEEIVPWAEAQGLTTDVATLAEHPDVRGLVQEHLDKSNAKYAQVEQVKQFFILDHDLSQETGELTPTLKVKRNVVNDKYAARFDALYG
jgi:long-chain acyl-CoA synthetase